MSKRVVAGSLMAGAMFVAGCSSPSPEVNNSNKPVPISTVSEMQIPQLPDQLPGQIAIAARRAVSIQVGYTVNQASGVRYDNDTVITAGHVVSDEHTHKLLPLQKNCENLDAYAPGGNHGLEAAHDKVAAIYDDTTDVAAFTLGNTLNGMPQINDTLDVATTPPKVGDVVYFVNYEPTGDHKMRSPTADTEAYRQPAIYGGVVMRSTVGDPTIEVLTGLKSYGVVPDTNSRPGASGGAVFEVVNGKAEYLGAVANGTLQGTAATPDDVASIIGTKPMGTPQGGLGLTGVQLVTPDTITALENQLHIASSCSFR